MSAIAHQTVASRETPHSGLLAIIRHVHQAIASHRSHDSTIIFRWLNYVSMYPLGVAKQRKGVCVLHLYSSPQILLHHR